MAAHVVRLVLASPDRRRVLARPNGLAGWTLPVVAVGDDPWTDDDLAAAGRIVGAPVRPVAALGDGAWEVEALDRVPAAGVTWIGVDEEAARLGADAAVVRRWAAGDEG